MHPGRRRGECTSSCRLIPSAKVFAVRDGNSTVWAPIAQRSEFSADVRYQHRFQVLEQQLRAHWGQIRQEAGSSV